MAAQDFVFSFGADWSAFIQETAAAVKRVQQEVASSPLQPRVSESGGTGTTTVNGRVVTEEEAKLAEAIKDAIIEMEGQAEAIGQSTARLKALNELYGEAAKKLQADNAVQSRLRSAQQQSARISEFVNPAPGTTASEALALEAQNNVKRALANSRAQLIQSETVKNLSAGDTGDVEGGIRGYAIALARGETEQATTNALIAAERARYQHGNDAYLSAMAQASIEQELTAAALKQVRNRTVLNALVAPGSEGTGAQTAVNALLRTNAENTVTDSLINARQLSANSQALAALTPQQVGEVVGGLRGYAIALARGQTEQDTTNALIAAERARYQHGNDAYLSATAQAGIEQELTAAAIKQMRNRIAVNTIVSPGSEGQGPQTALDSLFKTNAENAATDQLINARQIRENVQAIQSLTPQQVGELVGGVEGFARATQRGADEQDILNADLQRFRDEFRAADGRLIEATTKAALQAELTAGQFQAVKNQAFLRPELGPATNEATLTAQVRGRNAQNSVEGQLLQAQQIRDVNAAISRLRPEDVNDVVGGLDGFARALARSSVEQDATAQRIASARAQAQAADDTYIRNTVEAGLQQQITAAELTKRRNAAFLNPEAAPASGEGLLARQVINETAQAAASSEAVSALQERARIAALINSEGQTELRLIAARNLDNRQLNAALAEQTKNEIKARQATGEIAQGSLIQRIQAFVANRTSGKTGNVAIPEDFQNLGQLLSAKAVTTAGFAASGVGFFALFQGVRQVVDEATKFQTQLALIKTELANTGNAADFGPIKQGLIDISKETGIAADQLANLTVFLRGAFADQSSGQVLGQVKAIAELSKVTDVPLAEARNQIVAVAKTFNVSARDIGDTLVSLQSRFGVAASEILQFTGDLAPVAAQAGLTFQKLSTIGTVVEQLSGRSGAGLSEGLGRVLSGLQDNADKILSIYTSNAALSGHANEIASAIASGQTGAVLERLIRDYGLLTKSQQNLLASALGGSRQAPILNALFGGSPEIIKALDGHVSTAGKLDDAFKRLQNTLSQTFSELKQVAIQLGVALLNSGVIDFLKGSADAAKTLLDAIQPLIQAFGSLIGLFSSGGDGISAFLANAVKLAAVVGGIAAIRGVRNRPDGTSIGAGAQQGLSGVSFGLISKSTEVESAAGQATTQAVRAKNSFETYLGRTVDLQRDVVQATAAQTTRMQAISQQYSGLISAGVIALGVGLSSLSQQFKPGTTPQKVTSLAGNVAIGAGIGFQAGGPEGAGIGALIAAGTTILEQHMQAAAKAKQDEQDLIGKYKGFSTTKLKQIAGTGKTGSLGLGDQLFNTFADHVDPLTGFSNDILSGLGTGIHIPNVIGGAFHAVGGFLGIGGDNNGPDQQGTARKILEQRAADQLKKQLVALTTVASGDKNDPLTKALKDALNELDSIGPNKDNSDAAFKDFKSKRDKIIADVKAGKYGKISVKEALKKLQSQKDLTDLFNAASTADLPDSLSALKQEHDSGLISTSTYLNQLQKAKDDAQLVLTKNPHQQKFIDQLAATNKAISDATSQTVQSKLDLADKLRQYSGNDVQQSDIDRYVSALNDVKNFTDPSARQNALEKGLDLLHTLLQQKIDATQNVFEKLRLAQQGIPIPQELRREIAQLQVDADLTTNPKIQTELQQGIGSDDTQQLFSDTYTLVNAFGLIPAQALHLVLEGERKKLQDQEGAIFGAAALASGIDTTKVQQAYDKAFSAIDQAERDIASNAALNQPASGPSVVKGDASLINSLLQEAAQKTHDNIVAQLEYYKALNAGNPEAQANLDLQIAREAARFADQTGDTTGKIQAKTAAVNAQREQVQAIFAVRNAELNYFKALNQGDPISIAKLDQELAAQEAEQAARLGDQQLAIQAAIDKVNADHELQQAIDDQVNAQIELAIAVANAGGDTVAAAQKGLELAKQKLTQAQTEGVRGANLTTLQADVTTAQASLRDAQLQEAEGTIDFNLQAKKINNATAIAEYQALLNQADILHLTTAQRRDLILKIQDLSQATNADFQFNLPSELRLPTLYEVRRLNQSGGANNIDNRVITITLNTNADPAQVQSAVNTITNAVNTSPVLGTVSRRY